MRPGPPGGKIHAKNVDGDPGSGDGSVGLELNKVYRGDCVKRLAKIDAGSVDLVFADPPFNIGYDYDLYDDRRSRRDYLQWSRKWMAGVSRVSSTFPL